jgi:hypothetical protein
LLYLCKITDIQLNAKGLGIILLLVCQLVSGRAQDTLSNPNALTVDTLTQPIDSLLVGRDSVPETSPQAIRYSKDSLDAPVNYQARDSMVFDLSNSQFLMYGEGDVTYTDIKLKADYIQFDWTTNTVTSAGLADSLGRLTGKPQFTQGDQEFGAKEMKFNFKTRKGLITEASTIQNDLYVRGQKTKFISAKDSTETDVIFNEDAIFTTCDHPHPHFGIRSGKQKVVPNKLVVVGPSHLEVMGVPTPLWLPFGFFPMNNTRSTGLLFPNNFDYSPQWGYGLNNVGWYFPINEHLNLQTANDIYLNGSFRLRLRGDYFKRYKYKGNFQLEYHNLRIEDELARYQRETSYSLRVAHNQDAKAHPSRSIGGSINIQTNNAQRRNYNDAESVLAGQLSSNFNYRESFPGKPYNLAIGLSHSQNTQNRDITINFPTVNFQTQTLYPFKRKAGAGGKERFYEKIALTYRGEAKSTVMAKDTTLFLEETLQDIQYGARHQVTSNASFKLFKYINVNPNVNYTEVWYLKTTQKNFDPTVRIVNDTIEENGEIQIIPRDTIFGEVTDTTVFGFKPLRKFNTGVDFDTKLFGTILFKKGRLRGLRHVMTPRIGLNYTPDYTNPRWGYFDEVQQDTRDTSMMDLLEYTIFNEGLYLGERPSNQGLRMAVDYGISNFFEAKVIKRRDTVPENVRLIKRFDITGSYNFAAEEFKWSPINTTLNFSALQGIITLQLNARFDPYDINEEGQRIPVLVRDTRGQLLRFDDARASLAGTLTARDVLSWFERKDKGPESGNPVTANEDVRNPRLRELLESLTIRHRLVIEGETLPSGGDTIFISSNVITFSGRLPLTPNWRINVGNVSYDFVRKNVGYPAFGISRDLHCWEMGLNWQPSRGTYAFFLRVDPGSVFDFINLPYQKGNQDTFLAPGGFQGF